MMLGHRSLWFGVIMVLAIALPYVSMFFVVYVVVEDAGLILKLPVYTTLAIAHIWFVFRFFFPAMLRLARRAQDPGKQLGHPAPNSAVSIVLDQLTVLKRDLRFVFSKIGAWFDA